LPERADVLPLNTSSLLADIQSMSLISDEFPFSGPQPTEPHSVAEPQSPSQERRRSVRQTLVAKATLRSGLIPVAARPVRVSDISMLGIAFQSRIPMDVGDKHDLSLEVGPMRWASRVRVVSCTPNPDNTFDIGAEFVGNELNRRAA
jgi:hypothetical protein